MDGNESIAGIVFLGKINFELFGFSLRFKLVDLLFEFLGESFVLLFGEKFNARPDILELVLQAVPAFNILLENFPLFQEFLGRPVVLPELRVLGNSVYLLYFRPFAVQVKDAPVIRLFSSSTTRTLT
jgi:hypothetical protein